MQIRRISLNVSSLIIAILVQLLLPGTQMESKYIAFKPFLNLHGVKTFVCSTALGNGIVTMVSQVTPPALPGRKCTSKY